MTAQVTRFRPPDIEPLRGVYRPLADSSLLAEAFAEGTMPAPLLVLDLCCGSGFQGIAAAMLGHHVEAVDSEHAAVVSARRNALLNNVDLAARQGDLFEPVQGRCFDAILANPPYVPTPTSGHRAHRWCDGGADGRAVVDRICNEVFEFLYPGGSLWMVHSSLADVEKSAQMLRRAGFNVTEVAEQIEPFGPVINERLDYLIDRDLIEPGQTSERLVVLRATRS